MLSRFEVLIKGPVDNMSLFRPIDARLGVWIAYFKRQLRTAIREYVIKVKVTVQFPLINLSLIRPIDT